MRSALSVLVTPVFEGGGVGPVYSCLGVDISVCRGAPGDELLRIEVGAEGGEAAGLALGLDALRSFLPSVERWWQPLRIDHHCENGWVIRATIPRYRDDLGDRSLLLGHRSLLSRLLDGVDRLVRPTIRFAGQSGGGAA